MILFIRVAIGLLFLGALSSCYSSTSFKGDGILIDEGSGKGLRYAIEFPDVDLNQNTKYTFNFSSPPPTRLQGYLSLTTKPSNAFDGVFIRVILKSSEDQILQQREGILQTEWFPSLLGRYPYALGFFSHEFSSSQKYMLIIEVKTDSAGAGPLMAMPVFYGGGWGSL